MRDGVGGSGNRAAAAETGNVNPELFPKGKAGLNSVFCVERDGNPAFAADTGGFFRAS